MTENDLNDIQQRLEEHLVEKSKGGNEFFKSKTIADALDLTSKQVGANLGILQRKTDELTIEKWSQGSSGVTWQVTCDTDSKDASAHQSEAAVVAPLDG